MQQVPPIEKKPSPAAKNFLIAPRSHWILLLGMSSSYLLAFPINVFVSIMGGASPNSSGFFAVFLLLSAMEIGAMFFCVLTGKIIDLPLLRTASLRSFTYAGILASNLLSLLVLNVFIDQLFQWKQGNYGTIAFEFFALLGFWIFTIAAGTLLYSLFPKKGEPTSMQTKKTV